MVVFAGDSLDSRSLSNDRDSDRAIGFWVNIIRIDAEAFMNGEDRFRSSRILGGTDDNDKGEVWSPGLRGKGSIPSGEHIPNAPVPRRLWDRLVYALFDIRGVGGTSEVGVLG